MFSWIICIILSLLCLIMTLYWLFFAKKQQLAAAFWFLMLTGFFSYFPTYIEKYDLINAAVCDAVNLMQIVTLNSNTYETYQPQIASKLVFYLCISVRGCVHLAAPPLFAFATYTFIRKYLEKWKAEKIVKKKKRIYVFSCMNLQAQKIALSLAANSDKSTAVIFYETSTICEELEEQFGAKEVSHISHKMKLDVQTNKLPDIDLETCELYFILLNNSDENIELGLRLEAYYKNKIRFCNHIHIIAFSENSDSDETIIDSINTSLDLRVINADRIFSYRLMTETPLYHAIHHQKLSVLISGDTALAKELLSAVLLCGQLPDITLKIHLITEHAEAFREYLALYFPEILCSDYQIQISEGTPDNPAYLETIRSYDADVDYVILCDQDDSQNVRTAVMLRRFFLTDNKQFTHKPIIAARIKNTKKANIIRKSKFEIEPFGSDALLYSYQEITNSELEALAKRVHFAYCGIPENPDETACLEAIQSYYELEYNRKSSVAMALSISYKLWQMGFSMKPSAVPDVTVLKQYLADTDLTRCAEAEHQRWLAYVRSEGSRRMSVEDAEIIAGNAPQLMKKLGNSVYLGMHMDMIPLQEISAATAEINRRCAENTSFAPKKDTTHTDEFILRALPDILGNANWQRYTGGYVYKIEQQDHPLLLES
ncbi:MAG: hypothetical protein IJ642_09775 [Oscillospiraceae bacterium]|nr:hypothetical protein [Oscillospiraceae bacterium]